MQSQFWHKQLGVEVRVLVDGPFLSYEIRDISPPANYTDGVTAACRRS
jgi:hypothetical protein